VKSAYPFAETIARLKADVEAKGIKFFQEIDQAASGPRTPTSPGSPADTASPIARISSRWRPW
jgi:hypothetical protein